MKKKFLIFLTTCFGALSLSAQQPVSPNGKLTVTNSGQGISVNYQKQEVLNIPVLGYEGIKSNRLKFKPIWATRASKAIG